MVDKKLSSIKSHDYHMLIQCVAFVLARAHGSGTTNGNYEV